MFIVQIPILLLVVGYGYNSYIFNVDVAQSSSVALIVSCGLNSLGQQTFKCSDLTEY